MGTTYVTFSTAATAAAALILSMLTRDAANDRANEGGRMWKASVRCAWEKWQREENYDLLREANASALYEHPAICARAGSGTGGAFCSIVCMEIGKVEDLDFPFREGTPEIM